MKTKYVYPSSVSLTSRLTVALVPPILAALQCYWPEMGARTAALSRPKKRDKSGRELIKKYHIGAVEKWDNETSNIINTGSTAWSLPLLNRCCRGLHFALFIHSPSALMVQRRLVRTSSSTWDYSHMNGQEWMNRAQTWDGKHRHRVSKPSRIKTLSFFFFLRGKQTTSVTLRRHTVIVSTLL